MRSGPKLFLPLFLTLPLPACVAAPFIGAGSAALGGSVSYFKDGDVRYAATVPFDRATNAVEHTINELGFEVFKTKQKPDDEHPISTWTLRSDRGSAARLELRQVTSAVTVLHIDIDVLGQGSDSGPIARLFATQYEAALGFTQVPRP